MSKSSDQKTGGIPRLINFAYKHARLGEENKAREFWNSAISRGYAPLPKLVREFEKAIRIGKQENKDSDE